MRKTRCRGCLQVAAAAAMALGLTTPALGQTPSGFAATGGYVGGGGLLDFTFNGVTFDGWTYYQQEDGEEIFILPRLDTRRPVRLLAGYRGEAAALEISYDRARHSGTFADVPVKVAFSAVNIDGRFFANTRSRVQPHLLLGGALPWLTVKDGSLLDPRVADARFRGYGLNTEAGVTVYPHPRLGVSLGYAYRLMWFQRVRGVSDVSFDLKPHFRERSGTAILAGFLAL